MRREGRLRRRQRLRVVQLVDVDLGYAAEGVTSGAQLWTKDGALRCGQAVGQPNVSWYFPIADSLAYYGPKYGVSVW